MFADPRPSRCLDVTLPPHLPRSLTARTSWRSLHHRLSRRSPPPPSPRFHLATSTSLATPSLPLHHSTEVKLKSSNQGQALLPNIFLQPSGYVLTAKWHCEMMRLLDDHCARANKRRGAVLSAYDFLYVPMDFSTSSRHRSSNMGYAFVNFTTAEAARRLQNSLNGCHWKVFGSQKIIDVRAARIQGKDVLVKHFSRSTFACHTDEFLPAVFSPPRDGANADPKPKRVGNRVPPLFRWLCDN